MPTTKSLAASAKAFTEDPRELFLSGLVAKVANGDEAALTMLYHQLSRTIHAFALRRISNPAIAEEIIVETMYEVWRHAHRYATRSKVSTWVLGIARHKLLDRLRLSGIDSLMDEWSGEAETVADDNPESYLLLAERQQAEQIAQCLLELPLRQRECIHLVFYEDLSLAEVAEIQQCPVNTIKTRLFHARRKLRSSLEQKLGLAAQSTDESAREILRAA